ncbi:glyoxylase-like metal-dependent hydrolase (beta-lactamase superfamily II) [Flavobacterium sp. 90]|uniref:MBL fold metallo-hydrolase n=1 Tax=unclassified Flavobacterium TaxID=196869 RepID=UPI000EAEF262|nr:MULTISPECIES: MBL fold metallo-hydrolase [unclassified Flavobacterium]RKR05540.1 glyoxylase-like metal-dependent hydrolase (beta-lactamase superfamily II) [Flavobacterium sp. 81]TCK56855.1 glyoxylase-like metal-dependent hydrolase (beta-lactamase superfamily II) [Flavobacterium sp. 90]
MENQLPPAKIYLVKDTGLVKVHTLVSPAPMFANATHIIELPDELILIDGQFFAQYGNEFRNLADSLQKPISRFYVTHDHPDHYLGMGDAFANVPVYALEEIKASLEKNAPKELKEKQHHMGNLIAGRLSLPTQIVEPGEENIGGVKFIFERVLDTESPSTLVIKLPELKIAIVQDILYHNTHAFVTGPIDGWKTALRKLREDTAYDIFLPGHGKPANSSDLDNALIYLDQIETVKNDAINAEEYKNEVLKLYPNYAGAKLIDIYLPILYAAK